ncbi:MAG: hypothetical protein PVJ21_22580 [Anaerolineales bacterium]|jgi:hypothetical protein
MSEQRRFPWLPVLLGVGCVGMMCIGVLVFGGGAALFLTQRSASPSMPEPVATEVIVTQVSLPTATSSTPTSAPTPTNSGLSLTGDQYVDDHSLYDDFSSDALGWPVYNDNTTILKYEDEAYSFQIAEPEYIDWAYLPVNFVPYEIWFDVQGLSGPQDGTFGVFCQYQDVDNHYYVEFDLENNSYIIAQYLEGEDIPLTKQNTVGQYWYESNAFKASPDDVNRIGIGCYLEEITLFINDQLVDQVNVEQSFDQPGEAAFFVYTFDFAGPEGYKVFFDNVEIWQPVQ